MLVIPAQIILFHSLTTWLVANWIASRKNNNYGANTREWFARITSVTAVSFVRILSCESQLTTCKHTFLHADETLSGD